MSAYDDVVLSHAPALYWKLQEAFTGSGSAVPVADSSGNGRHGQAFFIFSRDPIVKGSVKAADFRANFGTIAYTGSMAALSASAAGLTFECWVLFTQDTVDQSHPYPMFMGNGQPEVTDGVYLLFDKSARSFLFRCGPHLTRTVQGQSYGTTPRGLFHLVGVLETDGTARLYVNGVADGAPKGPTTVYPAPGGDFRVGNTSFSQNFWFKGGLSNAAVYSYPLTAAQVLAHYKAGLWAILGRAIVKPSTPFEKVVAVDAATFAFAAEATPEADGSYHLTAKTQGPFYVFAISAGVRPVMHGPIVGA